MSNDGWTLEQRLEVLLSNWVRGEIPQGLIEDLLLFARIYGPQMADGDAEEDAGND